MKDWTGNSTSVYKTLGASNHTDHDREKNDYYATDPIAAEWLLKIEPTLNNIWEPACGEFHLANIFAKYGKLGYATDLVDRGYGIGNIDFLKENIHYEGDIVTNPPYKYAQQFVEHAMEVIPNGRKVCMFLKLTFLESKARRELFTKYPPIRVWVSSSRIKCAMNGEFTQFNEKTGKMETPSSAAAYAWIVWEKGYTGDTIVKWFN